MTWETRVAYTAFLAFSLAAYVAIGLLVYARTGVADAAYVAHYAGDESRELYGKTYAELLETTHFHLFAYPMWILVQGHLFLLTGWPPRLKAWIVVLSFLGAALYLAAPWLVVYGSPAWVWTKTAGRALLVPTLALFLIVPFYEMWLRPNGGGRPTLTEEDDPGQD